MEEGVYRLPRGMCLVARRLKVVAVARLLWISWCVLGGVGFLMDLFFSIFFLRTHTAYSKYEATLPHLHLC